MDSRQNQPNQMSLDQGEGNNRMQHWPIMSIKKKHIKIMILGSFFGLFLAIFYILIAPQKYEATAQIRMAQLSQINPANPFGTSIEDPLSLISRMQFPTNYSKEVVNACGYQDEKEPALELSKDLKFSIPRGVANTVEIRALFSNPETARNCLVAVTTQVELMQEQVARPFIEEAKIKLAADNERIEAAKKVILKADQSGNAMSAGYLSARDELTYFLIDREKMVDLINSVKNRGTRLTSPIYVTGNPVSPKKVLSLVIGVLGGIFLGLLWVLSPLLITRFKNSIGLILDN